MPSTEIELEISQYLASALEHHRSELRPETALIETGLLDSMGILDLIEFLESRFGISLGDADMVPEHFQNIQTVTSLVERRLLKLE